MKPFFAIIFAAALCTGAGAQDLGLKEFTLGAEMSTCPGNTVKQTVTGLRLMCKLNATTLANQDVLDVTISIYDGRLIGAFFNLGVGGQYSHPEVLAALQEKFGKPSRAKPHLNQYSWDRGQKSLGFDGWKGHVILVDFEAEKQLRSKEASTNKADL